jgi:hypothetical protein
MLVGETDIVACPAPVPVPVNVIVETVGFVFAVIEILPVTAVDALGVNFAVKPVLFPAATEMGNVNPETENPVPVAAS